jgi:hypothetical protein
MGAVATYSVDAYHAGNVRLLDDCSFTFWRFFFSSPVFLQVYFISNLCTELTSLLQNHSCDPNCEINPCYINEANIDKPLLTVFTKRDVEPSEELSFSYMGCIDDDMVCHLLRVHNPIQLTALSDIQGQKREKEQRCCLCGMSLWERKLFGSAIFVNSTFFHSLIQAAVITF